MGTPPMPSGTAAELEAVRDVLRAMSRSQPDLDAVLGSACEHAVKLCGAEFGFVFIPEGEKHQLIAAPDTMNFPLLIAGDCSNPNEAGPPMHER